MANADIAGILDDVVHQFSEPLVFLRELIQNSIDAGTREVEVSVELHDDLALVRVEDWGSGMTRQIIDRQLCRLFSSTKYGDYTQIGRFGIGFVSVYAVEPEWVCVDTGRSGENWRVLFLPDHSFEVYRLSEPIEGTRVTVAKRIQSSQFEDFRRSSFEVVRRWCKHVPLPVYFDGEDVREPFELEAFCAAEHREEGTRLVAGLVAQMNPLSSFYNRGLLLKETEDARWPHLQFKVDSRYLEHTLTRDDVVHDRGYERIDVILDRIATEELPRRLMNELGEAAVAADLQTLDELYPLVASLARHAPETVKGWKKELIFPTVGEEVLSLREIERFEREDRLFVAHSVGELASRVSRENAVLLLHERDHLVRFGIDATPVEKRFALVHLEEAAEDAFEKALRKLFGRFAGYSPVFRRARVEASELVPLTGSTADGIIDLAELRLPADEANQVTLVLDHPLTTACLRYAGEDPDLGARAFFSALYPRLAGAVCREGIEALQ